MMDTLFATILLLNSTEREKVPRNQTHRAKS